MYVFIWQVWRLYFIKVCNWQNIGILRYEFSHSLRTVVDDGLLTTAESQVLYPTGKAQRVQREGKERNRA